MRRFLCAGLLLLSAGSQAQIAPISPARQRAAERQARREAQRTATPYQESLLDAASQPVRRGSSTPRPRVAGEPRFSRDGTPHVTEPKFPGLRRRTKTEPKP